MENKVYPTNYPDDAVRILDGMSLDNGKGVELVGSASLRTQLYAGDYDANDNVSGTLNDIIKRFREMIKRLLGMENVYIGDIKSGAVEDWRVIPFEARVHNGKIIGYNAERARSKVEELHIKKVITRQERDDALKLLKSSPSLEEFVRAKKEIKFHTQRWTIEEVLRGFKTLKNGSEYTLEDAFTSRGITKVDVVGWVQNNRYTDFAMIYFFFSPNGRSYNYTPIHFDDEVKEDIIHYKSEGNYFKVLKREFALAKYHQNKKKMDKLTEILNSDLGRMYHILGDIKTLRALLDEQKDVPLKDVRFEIDQFKQRFANIVLEPFVRAEHTLLGYINSALKTSSQKLLSARLGQMEDILTKLLSKQSKKLVGGVISKELYDSLSEEEAKQIGYTTTALYHYLYPESHLASIGLRRFGLDMTTHNKEGKDQNWYNHEKELHRREEDYILGKGISPDVLEEKFGKDYKDTNEARDYSLKLLDLVPKETESVRENADLIGILSIVRDMNETLGNKKIVDAAQIKIDEAEKKMIQKKDKIIDYKKKGLIDAIEKLSKLVFGTPSNTPAKVKSEERRSIRIMMDTMDVIYKDKYGLFHHRPIDEVFKKIFDTKFLGFNKFLLYGFVQETEILPFLRWLYNNKTQKEIDLYKMDMLNELVRLGANLPNIFNTTFLQSVLPLRSKERNKYTKLMYNYYQDPQANKNIDLSPNFLKKV